MVLKNNVGTLNSRRKEKAEGSFQGRGPATKLCLHHMKILCAPLYIPKYRNLGTDTCMQ